MVKNSRKYQKKKCCLLLEYQPAGVEQTYFYKLWGSTCSIKLNTNLCFPSAFHYSQPPTSVCGLITRRRTPLINTHRLLWLGSRKHNTRSPDLLFWRCLFTGLFSAVEGLVLSACFQTSFITSIALVRCCSLTTVESWELGNSTYWFSFKNIFSWCLDLLRLSWTIFLYGFTTTEQMTPY